MRMPASAATAAAMAYAMTAIRFTLMPMRPATVRLNATARMARPRMVRRVERLEGEHQGEGEDRQQARG